MKKQNAVMTEVVVQKLTFTDSSKDKVIESLKRRIQDLKQENQKLKNQNSILLGKLAT